MCYTALLYVTAVSGGNCQKKLSYLLDLITGEAGDKIVFPPEHWAATFRSHAQLVPEDGLYNLRWMTETYFWWSSACTVAPCERRPSTASSENPF